MKTLLNFPQIEKWNVTGELNAKLQLIKLPQKCLDSKESPQTYP